MHPSKIQDPHQALTFLIVFVLVSGFALWRGIRTGRTGNGRLPPISRDDDPRGYWSQIGMGIGFAIAIVGVMLVLMIRRKAIF